MNKFERGHGSYTTIKEAAVVAALAIVSVVFTFLGFHDSGEGFLVVCPVFEAFRRKTLTSSAA